MGCPGPSPPSSSLARIYSELHLWQTWSPAPQAPPWAFPNVQGQDPSSVPRPCVAVPHTLHHRSLTRSAWLITYLEMFIPCFPGLTRTGRLVRAQVGGCNKYSTGNSDVRLRGGAAALGRFHKHPRTFPRSWNLCARASELEGGRRSSHRPCSRSR